MRLGIGSIAVILLAGAAVPAQATDYLITYTGTVVSGGDSGTFLGAPGNLNGLSYTASYILRWPTPTAIFTTDGATHSEIKGGTSFGAGVASPLSASLTINGVTVTFSGKVRGYTQKVHASQLGMVDQIYDEVTSVDVDPVTNTQFSGVLNESVVGHPGLSMFDDFDPTSPFTYVVMEKDVALGNFDFFHAVNGNDDANASGRLRPDTVSVAPLSADVPEPASWATMIAGFGLIGTSLRRRARFGDLRIGSATTV